MAKKTYSRVLGWGSPFDMSCKLEAEIGRMKDATDLRALVEHAMNCAMTAYHMIDWVWAAIATEPKDSAKRYEKDAWIVAIGARPKDAGASTFLGCCEPHYESGWLAGQ